jgi:hypothetical protein
MHHGHRRLVMGRRSPGRRHLPPLDRSHRRVRSGIHIRRHHHKATRQWHAHPRMSPCTDERARRRRCRRLLPPCSALLLLSFFSSSQPVNWRMGARVRGASSGTIFVRSNSTTAVRSRWTVLVALDQFRPRCTRDFVDPSLC